MMKIWEKLEGKSSYHFPNSWWVRGRIVPNTCILKKLWRANEDQIKPRTSELFDFETLEHFNIYTKHIVQNILLKESRRLSIKFALSCWDLPSCQSVSIRFRTLIAQTWLANLNFANSRFSFKRTFGEPACLGCLWCIKLIQRYSVMVGLC